MSEIIYKIDGVSGFRLGLFATGSYQCICSKCCIDFTGDKRAVHCLKCSIELYDDGAEAYNRLVDTLRTENEELEGVLGKINNLIKAVNDDSDIYYSEADRDRDIKEIIRLSTNTGGNE